jgi:carboxymethylenebutenolidase
MVDTDVVVTTADGSCDAALIHPKGKGPWPGIILFVDVFGLRPTMRDMAKRLAADGYTCWCRIPTTVPPRRPGCR